MRRSTRRYRILAFAVVLIGLAIVGCPPRPPVCIPISSIEELQRIGNDPGYPLDTSYYLTQDIDASVTATWNGGAGFAPIGALSQDYGEYYPELAFTGTFDGKGYVINDLTICRPEQFPVGLFAVVGGGGVIQNLGLEGGAVTGLAGVGGLVGYNVAATISECYATGAVTAMGTAEYDAYAGGLVGFNEDGCISKSCATGAVTSTGDSAIAGGLAGANSEGTISKSYATGAVTATGSWVQAGGLLGGNQGGAISQCYATGAVTSTGPWQSLAGGLVGVSSSGTISECYAVGAVTATGGVEELYAGGLLADKWDGTVKSSFWDTETSGMTESDGGTGLPTALMQTESTFADAGWDFVEVWYMLEGGSYPYLWDVP